MRIACLQFNPKLGDVAHNIKRAETILAEVNPRDLDLLVLPEMAFTGYKFRSLPEIRPFLEPTAAGVTTSWARTTACRLRCYVIVGYPESCTADPETHYNSAVLVSPQGEVLTNYHKTFLFSTDESWASEGAGYYSGELQGLGKVAVGICMDLNPKGFTAPFGNFEFANHVLDSKSRLAVVPMAWLATIRKEDIARDPEGPDMETLRYWIQRFLPVLESEGGEAVVVACNRVGVEDGAVFAGTSVVFMIREGRVKVFARGGAGTEELVVGDVTGWAGGGGGM